MDSPASYFEWGFVLISIPNVLFLATMVALFALALLLPFPHASDAREPRDRGRG